MITINDLSITHYYSHIMKQTQAEKIANLTAQGMTGLAVAKELGVCPATVYRRRQDDDVKALIEEAQKRVYRSNLNTIADTVTGLVQGYKQNDCSTDKAKFEKNHGFRVIERMCEAVGIFPAHTQSVFVQAIYNDNRTELSPIVADLLKSHNLLPDDPIEAELIEDRQL